MADQNFAGGVFGCCDDVAGCCVATLCPVCVFSMNAERAGMTSCIPACCMYVCASYCYAGCLVGAYGRGFVRHKYSPQTTPFGGGIDFMDVICHMCCPICSIAQETRALNQAERVGPVVVVNQQFVTQAPPPMQYAQPAQGYAQPPPPQGYYAPPPAQGQGMAVAQGIPYAAAPPPPPQAME